MSDAGNSNRITREYLDSLLIETRYLDSSTPNLDFRLFGKSFSSPIMTAALSHLDHFMFPGAAVSLARGTAEAHTVLWYGMADESEIERLASFSTNMIEIIKPYADRDIIYRKIEHAAGLGLLAVGIDIDHAFSADGSNDTVDGFEMSPLLTSELEIICKQFSLPVIVKGVLSIHDAPVPPGWFSLTITIGLDMLFLRLPFCLKSYMQFTDQRLFSLTVKYKLVWMHLKHWHWVLPAFV